MPSITANGLTIAYEDYGEAAAPPILLVMGLGAQLTLWPIELVEALVARGFRVIRYDNRDIGLSTKLDHAGVPNMRWLMLKSVIGLPVRSPYSLADMAADGVGLLDAMGIDRAHIVGASMGGMITQHIGGRHGDRALSLTSIMSTTGNRRLPKADPKAVAALTNRPANGDPETLIGFGKAAARALAGDGFPFDEERIDQRVRADFARSYSPAGFMRQLAAIIADGDRRAMLARITAPTLVIHGESDPLVPLAGGQDTAQHIRGARLVTFPGMGHDLPLPLIEPMVDAIAGHCQSATAG